MMLRHALRWIAPALIAASAAPAAGQEAPDGWFPFDADGSLVGGVLDASDWLGATAGEHGPVSIDAERGGFAFANGTLVKFWGVNTANGRPYVDDPEQAAQWARFLAAHGINAYRLHKFTAHGLSGMPGSTQIDPDRWAGLDTMMHALRTEGIYYGWSPVYGHKPHPADRDRLLAYDEIAGIELPWAHLNGSTSFLVYFADDLQDLHIELMTNMLRHVNPHTGLSYADDPALIFVELLNEETIFWSAHEAFLEQTPTYRAVLCRKFSDWLLDKYGDQAALERAWDGHGLEDGQSLAKRNVYPHPNHSWFSGQFADAEQAGTAVPRHVLDRAEYLFAEQTKFYEKFVKSIRETGYAGPIVTSCWQAGEGITHFMNLASDATVAGEPMAVDRHNYFAGRPDRAMVDAPGSGLLSTGLQQVQGRPFQLSEWLSTDAAQWSAEAAPLVAAYGMGLQGWDASYAYCNNMAQWNQGTRSPVHGQWNTDTPLHLGLYPALSRMVHRGDVREGDVVSERSVHVPSLADGRLGFSESVEQAHDYKSFGGTVGPETIAAGRVVVDFADTPTPTTPPDLSDYLSEDGDGQVIRSNTGQLAWHYGEGQRGYVAIDTDGTQGLVGFAGGRSHTFGEATIALESPFAVVLLTSLDRDAGIADARRLLLTTVANGQDVGEGRDARLYLEPVALELTLPGGRPFAVNVLDHHGHRTGKTLPVESGRVQIDGSKTRAMFYEIVFE